MINLRNEAYSILLKVFKDNLFSDKLLHKYHNKINNNEERLLYNLVKGTIKRKVKLDYIANSLTDEAKFDKTDLKIKTLIYLSLYQLLYCSSIPSYATVNESVELAKKLFNEKVASFLNALLRSYLNNPEITYPQDIVKRLSVEHSYPEYLIENWLSQFGEEETELLCMYFNDNPKLSIRVNSIATTAEKLVKYFEKKGVTLNRYEGIHNVFHSDRPEILLNDVALGEGYYSVQDASAAMIVNCLDPQKNESIIDFFAGPGGKVTYIAELMNNTGEIIAIDKSPQKIKKIRKNLSTLQLNNTILVKEDFKHFGPKAPAYHRVILDVPCTGWGVLQKKPELRWQQNQDLQSLLKLQENALNYGSEFVRPGGFLVYSTCTMNPEENEIQVEKFLKRNKNFTPVDINGLIPKKYTDGFYLKTIPHAHNMDGAFAAKMQKHL